MSPFLQTTAVSLIQGAHRELTWLDSPARSKAVRLSGVVFYGFALQTFAVLASSYFTASTVLKGCVLVLKTILNRLQPSMWVTEDLRGLKAEVSADGRRAIHFGVASCALPILLAPARWSWAEPSADLGGAWKSMLSIHAPELLRISFPPPPKKNFFGSIVDLASSKFLPVAATFKERLEAQLKARGVEPQHFYQQLRVYGAACLVYACVAAIFLPADFWYPARLPAEDAISGLGLATTLVGGVIAMASVAVLSEIFLTFAGPGRARRERIPAVQVHEPLWVDQSLRGPKPPVTRSYLGLKSEPGIRVFTHVDGKLALFTVDLRGRQTITPNLDGVAAKERLSELSVSVSEDFLDFAKGCCAFPRNYGEASIRDIAYVDNRRCWVADVYSRRSAQLKAVTFTKTAELENLAQELIEAELDRTYKVSFDLTCGPGVVPFPDPPADTPLSALTDLAKGTDWQAATELLVRRINGKEQHLGVPKGERPPEVEGRRLWYDELETYLRCNVKKVLSLPESHREGAISQILCGLADANERCGGAWYDQAESDYIRLHPEVGGVVNGWSRLRRCLKAEKLDVLDRIGNDHYEGDVHRKKHLRRILAPRLDIASSRGADVFGYVNPDRAETLFKGEFLRTVTPSRMLRLCHEGVKMMKKEDITKLFLPFPTDFITQCAQASWANDALSYGPNGISDDVRSKIKKSAESGSLDEFEPTMWVDRHVLKDGYPTRWGMMVILMGMHMIEPKDP